MGLTDRERQCIDALCSYLTPQYGATWSDTGVALDAKYPSQPTPETIISNGIDTVAVEVKAVMGTDEDTRARSALISLRKRLCPRRPGTYLLMMPPGWKFPWDPRFVRAVKREIERICWQLVEGHSGYIRVPRKARLSKLQAQGQFVRCLHGLDPVPGLSEAVRGAYLLLDDRPDHDFHTGDTRKRSLQMLLGATMRADRGKEDVWAEWQEEWELKFFENDIAKVELAGFVRWFWAEPTAREAMRLRIRDANKKFRRRHAARHAVILDNDHMLVGLDEVFTAFENIDAEEYRDIDEVYLYEGGVIKPIFSRE